MPSLVVLSAQLKCSFGTTPSPLTGDVQRAYGRVLVKLERFAEAAQVLEPLAGDAQADPQLSYALALAWLGTGKFDQAAERFEQLLQDETAGGRRAEILTALASLEIERRHLGLERLVVLL